MSQPKLPSSLLDVLLAYEAHVRTSMPQKKANEILAQVRTALWRYTLPGWKFPSPKGQRLSQEEYEQGLVFLQAIPLERLKEAPEVQERLFEQLAVAGNSRRNYRWALNRFIDWCQQQAWFEAEFEATARRSVPRKRQHKQSANDVRLTTRRARPQYRLADHEISEALRQELDLFFQFLTASEPDGGELKSVSTQTATQYLNQVLRVLGWLHTYQAVPLSKLSLRRLVEVDAGSTGNHQSDCWLQVNAEAMVELVQAYLQWLRAPGPENLDERSEAVQSPYTEIQVINTWLAIAFFLSVSVPFAGNGTEMVSGAIAALKELRKEASARLKSHQSVSDESKKRLEWHEFLDLVEQLRGECVSRFPQSTQSKQGGSTSGSLRSLTAIAYSYQRFLLAALLSYIPPQRSQVLRNLLISPSSLLGRSFDAQGLSDEESELYREQDAWWIRIVDRMSTRQSSHYLVFVPNLDYADKRCFYQYLNEWLSHYVYEDAKGNTVEVPGLRSCFNPHHLRFFTMKNGLPYRDSSAFIKLLRHPAYRLTGKAIDFQMVRRVYSDYLRTKESAGGEIESFAQVSEGETLPHAFNKIDGEEYDYDPEDWHKAAEIAQTFLNQMVEGAKI